MSYRTYVNDVQIFGNGESCPEWIDFIKSQGINVNEECYYDGYITDFMGAVEVLEKIVLRLNNEREKLKKQLNDKIGVSRIQSLFDFTNKPKLIENQDVDETYGYSLLDELFGIVNDSYAFIPYAFYEACKNDLIKEHVYTTKNHFYCFKLKDGAKIHVEAH